MLKYFLKIKLWNDNNIGWMFYRFYLGLIHKYKVEKSHVIQDLSAAVIVYLFVQY